MSSQPFDTPHARKERGAFFTPPAIADFLARWAIGDNPTARVMDPTCGEAVFLLAAADRLRALGAPNEHIARQLTGVDIHQRSLDVSAAMLAEHGVSANLVRSDFFDLPTPAQFGDAVGWQDAIVGNPPFVRYQEHKGAVRKRSAAAALEQGVRLSGLASSWAATLVHASAFLKPTGRLAMVLPAELLTVGYAEPLRRWLRRRFAAVNLFMFSELQFRDAEENVVLVVARDSGPCDSFGLYTVDTGDDLTKLHPADNVGANPAAEGKWSDLLLPLGVRQQFRQIALDQMVPLSAYGTVELGTVTGANDYFTLSEPTRRQFDIPKRQLKRLSPPGSRHFDGFAFTDSAWSRLRKAGERVWLFNPGDETRSRGVHRYLAHGVATGIPSGYKCRVRQPWWRPPAVPPPDLFFTYMSHRYPRMIANDAGVTMTNSMHGVRLREASDDVKAALPLVMLNSGTMLGAEVMGRAYGGGILKMEPREAARLPLPRPSDLLTAWDLLRPRQTEFEQRLRRGEWWSVVAAVDDALLSRVMGVPAQKVNDLRDWATVLRVRRTRQDELERAPLKT